MTLSQTDGMGVGRRTMRANQVKQISTITDDILTKLSTPSTQETELQPDSTRSMRIWVQLAEMFGKAFYREMGSEPSSLWTTIISRLSDEQLTRGLKNLANDNLSFPPNLSQFASACNRIPPRRFNGVKSLPNPGAKTARHDLTPAEKEKAKTARRDALTKVGLWRQREL